MNSSEVTHIKSFLARGLKPALLATAILLLAAALPALAGQMVAVGLLAAGDQQSHPGHRRLQRWTIWPCLVPGRRVRIDDQYTQLHYPRRCGVVLPNRERVG